ncbi:MAG TPA: hypothetical protein VEH02_09025, partial [Pseudolabrys sp.]|nr:hypothetical protein [Pseudolabrys sp.]
IMPKPIRQSNSAILDRCRTNLSKQSGLVLSWVSKQSKLPPPKKHSRETTLEQGDETTLGASTTHFGLIAQACTTRICCVPGIGHVYDVSSFVKASGGGNEHRNNS